MRKRSHAWFAELTGLVEAVRTDPLLVAPVVVVVLGVLALAAWVWMRL